MKLTIASLAFVATFACAACSVTRVDPTPLTPESITTSTTNASATPSIEGVLYARDGTPVTSTSKGAARIEPEPKRDLGDSEGGRASLLELYTKSVADKSALAEEVVALKATLEVERKAVMAGIEERGVLRGELSKLLRERDTLLAETMDLAARLTSAQIARLEAQKTLLEIQIDQRMREEAAASVQGSSKDKDKKRSGGERK
ncbi:MAG: hypothetical protein SGI72_03950 [Planctomycetota bacterium]|nr:hypothetical protein [Planctomycetota bacterium]